MNASSLTSILIWLPVAGAILICPLPLSRYATGALAMLFSLAEVGFWIEQAARCNFSQSGLQMEQRARWFGDLGVSYHVGVSVKYDNSDNKKPGWKFAEYELKGVPVRLAMGGRDLENNTVEVARRDTLTKETVTCDNIENYIKDLLDEIQKNIYQKAYDFREKTTQKVETYAEFKEKIEEGGFILAHWDGTAETEALIKEETKATIRCIPLEGDKTPGVCMVTGKPSVQRVLFARAY